MSSAPPDWFARGIGHVWLPYTQMKTAAAPLPSRARKEAAFISATAANSSTESRAGGPPATAITTRIFARRSWSSSA